MVARSKSDSLSGRTAGGVLPPPSAQQQLQHVMSMNQQNLSTRTQQQQQQAPPLPSQQEPPSLQQPPQQQQPGGDIMQQLLVCGRAAVSNFFRTNHLARASSPLLWLGLSSTPPPIFTNILVIIYPVSDFRSSSFGAHLPLVVSSQLITQPRSLHRNYTSLN